ncbi:MAG: DUF3618 domain-containing protein [Chitinispirillaceae bacterium]
MDIREKKVAGNGHVAIHDWSPVDETGHHKSSDQIENDIQETRHTMDTILDAMEGKVNPRTILDRFIDSFQKPENRQKVSDTMGTIGKSIYRSFQRNPLPMMMVTAGTAWAFWENRKETKEPQYYREPMGPSAAEQAQGAAGKMGERAGQAKEKLSGAQQKAKGTASDLSGKATEGLRSGAERTDKVIHDNPLITGAIAMVAGLVAGALAPETEAERKTVGEESKEVQKEVEETGKGVSEAAEKGLSENKPEGAQEQTLPARDLTLKPENTDTNPLDISQSELEKRRKESEGDWPQQL